MDSKILLALFGIVLLALAGCEELPITGNAVLGGDGSIGSQEDYEPEYVDTEDEVVENAPECSDGIDNDEDGFVDMKDSGCDSAEDDSEKSIILLKEEESVKEDGKTAECSTDAECVDTDPCTIDSCYFAGDLNAYCANEKVTRKTQRNNDGCCPEWADVDTDMDCKPVCGNGVCEYGENERLCLKDCEHTGESGKSEEPSGDEEEGGEETYDPYGPY